MVGGENWDGVVSSVEELVLVGSCSGGMMGSCIVKRFCGLWVDLPAQLR